MALATVGTEIARTPDDLLSLAVRVLAGRVPGADAAGRFTGTDGAVGRPLASKPVHLWSHGERYLMWQRLKSYRTQLARVGIRYDAIPRPEAKRVTRIPAGQPVRPVHTTPQPPGWKATYPWRPGVEFVVRSVGPDNQGKPVGSIEYGGRVVVGMIPLGDAKARADAMNQRIWEWLAGAANPAHVPERPRVDSRPRAELRRDRGRYVVILRWSPSVRAFHHITTVVRDQIGAWYNKSDRTWTVTPSPANVPILLDMFGDYDFAVPDDLADMLRTMTAKWESTIAKSLAKEGSITVPGLNPALAMYPFQAAGVHYAIDHRRVLFADTMGLGKTVEAIATVQMSRAYPVLVIAPASLKLNWKREFMRWVPGVRVAILRGTRPNLTGDAIRRAADVVIINYDILGDYDYPTKQDEKGETVPDRSKPRRFTGWATVLADVNFSAVICDEIHLCRNKTSRRNRVTTAITNTIDWCILLSGTPIVNRPAEMWPIIEMLHIQPVFGGQSKFERRYTGAKKGRFGWDTSGAGHMAELNTIMRANGMVRRRKEDVLTELPPLTWADHVVELAPADRAEYDRAEADLANHIAGVKGERENIRATITATADAQFPHPGTDDATAVRTWERERDAWITAMMGEWYRTTAQASKQAEQLARYTYLRQLAARAKLKETHTFIDTFHEAGEKTIVFGWHREFVTGLADKYHAPTIMGGMRTEAVEANKALFQTDPGCMTIVLNIEAGGVGHTLTAASNVIFFEFGWNPAAMEQGAGRSHRIGQDKPVTAWRVIAADTIDEDFIAIIEAKEVVVNEGTDGTPEQHDSMMDAIRKRIVERQARRAKR